MRSTRMNQKIELISVDKYFDVFCACSECGRMIKNVYVTNTGNMGRRCFFKALGYKMSNYKKEELPKEAIESLAKEMIRFIENLPKKDLLKGIRYLPETMKYNPFFLSYNCIRTYTKQVGKTDKTTWENQTVDIDLLLREFDKPTKYMKEIKGSETYRVWFFKCAEMVRDNKPECIEM